jgi:hypothetical protein
LVFEPAAARGGKVELELRAETLEVQTLAALDAPMARILPEAVRGILARQADLIRDMARAIERLESLIDIGDAADAYVGDGGLHG